MRTLKAVMAVLVLGAFALAWGQTSTRTTPYATTAPTTGSPVKVYHWELSVDDGPFIEVAQTATLTCPIELPWNATARVRVRGEDADGDLGPYSPVSDPFTPDRPGACGKPVRQ